MSSRRRSLGYTGVDLKVRFILAGGVPLLILLVLGGRACSSTSSTAERACLAYGAPAHATYRSSEPYAYERRGFLVSYTVPEKRGFQYVGCVRTNGDFDPVKTKVMFDAYAVPLREKCLAEEVSLAPPGTHARMKHVYGYREAGEMEMLSRYEKFCTIERMRQRVLEEAVSIDSCMSCLIA